MAAAINPLADLQVQAQEEMYDEIARNDTYTEPAPLRMQISEKQEALIRKLVVEKDTSTLLSQRELENFDAFLRTLTPGWGGTGSQLIDALFNAPRKNEPVYDGPAIEVPDGYYGVDGKRYKIDAPKTGKWAGYIFFKTGSDYYEQQRLGMVRPGGTYRGKAEDVFNQIVADPEAAGQEYARITGNCYACNRTLEDPVSVALGIGPVCRTK